MKIYLRLEPPLEWVRVSGQKVEAFGEVSSIDEYPIGPEEDVIGVVPGEWVATHQVTLPAKTKKQFSAALPYALEESISEDVDNMHFVYPVWKAGEPCTVTVVAKAKMLQWQALANDHRLPIEHLVPDHSLVPFHESADCSVAFTDDQLLANHKNGFGVSLDKDLLDVWLMDVPMTATIAVNDEAMTEQLIANHPDRDFRHWPFGTKMAHWLEYQPEIKVDLWADKYKPTVSRLSKKMFLMPAMLLVAALLIKMVYDTYHYFALHSEIAAIQAESQALLKETFPMFDSVTPGTERQMMEQAISRMAGPDNSKSMQSMLAAVSTVLARRNITLTDLVFRNDELTVTCLLSDFSQVDALTKQLNSVRTLNARLQSSSSEDGQVIATYSIRQT